MGVDKTSEAPGLRTQKPWDQKPGPLADCTKSRVGAHVIRRDRVSQAPREHPGVSLLPPGSKAHLLRDVIVTGVNAVPEQVLSAAVAAAEVAAVHELPARVEGGASGCRGPLGTEVQIRAPSTPGGRRVRQNPI